MPGSNQVVVINIHVFGTHSNANPNPGQVGGPRGKSHDKGVESDAAAATTSHTVLKDTLRARKDDFLAIKSKHDLLDYIKPKLPPHTLPKSIRYLKFTRKSKKHKCFIPLDNEEDFKSLARSLKVKNHVNLNVEMLPLSIVSSSSSEATPSKMSTPSPSRSASSSSTSSSSSARTAVTTETTATTATTAGTAGTAETAATADATLPPIPSIDFARLGDALLEATLEHFKDFFIENRHKETDSKEDPTGTHKNKESGATSSSSGADTTANSKDTFRQEDTVVVHPNIACDRCSPDDFVPLKGVRYCCLVCSNYDLCADCEGEQQAAKLTYGSHSYLHPMAKITEPDSFTRDSFTNKFNVNGAGRAGAGGVGVGVGGSFDPFTDSRPNDIIYDIPFLSCSAENRLRLESLLQSKGFENFIKNVDGYISRSDKYSQLLSILDANGFSFSNQDDSHRFLEVCIEDYLLRKAFKESVNEDEAGEENQAEQAEEGEQDEQDVDVNKVTTCDAVVNLSLGSKSTKSSIQLINKSSVTIDGGDFQVELVDGSGEKYSSWVKSAAIKPGQVKFYKLNPIPQEFIFNDHAKLAISTPKLALTSFASNQFEFQMEMTIESTEEQQSREQGEVVISTTSKEKSANELELINDYATSQNPDDVTVSYKIQSRSIFSVEVRNNSSTPFTGHNTKGCVYVQGEEVMKSEFHHPHGFKRGLPATFNFVSPKYDFSTNNDFANSQVRLEFEFDGKKAECYFFEGQTEASLIFLNNEEGSASSSITSTEEKFEIVDEEDKGGDSVGLAKDVSESLDDNATTRSVSSAQSASFHSMRLPVLARESVDLSEFMDARNGSGKDEGDKNDYDVLEEDEIDSDYEILSLASTDSF
ncbi:hypothetical protein KGF57_000279 [Candida theae]|uniref:ZZ-type domain-containing protein n=1 Tax=Candida theae TaxID=1198502 RepID=A0AAD5G0S8_9ASCO|nr:uncharacterized protein KGF57_000279 [Candida theae]KAI5967851.1 hypothetical protein KGF57_000279 [Candida theae]